MEPIKTDLGQFVENTTKAVGKGLLMYLAFWGCMGIVAIIFMLLS